MLLNDTVSLQSYTKYSKFNSLNHTPEVYVAGVTFAQTGYRNGKLNLYQSVMDDKKTLPTC